MTTWLPLVFSFLQVPFLQAPLLQGAETILGPPDPAAPGESVAPPAPPDDLGAELEARQEDLVRTEARLARLAGDRDPTRAALERTRAERGAAFSELRVRVRAAYRTGHVARLAWMLGERGRAISRGLVVLARQARAAETRRASAEAAFARASERSTRFAADEEAARSMRAALLVRAQELRRALGLPEPPAAPPPPPPESEPEPAAPPTLLPAAVKAKGQFVHPVWSTLPLLWVKRGSETPILRYPAFRGALIRSSYDGRVVSIERVRRYGKVVRIDHGFGVQSALSGFLRATVEVGDTVRRGGILGRARGPVHFELLEGDRNVDPRPWMGIPVTRQ